MNVVAAVRRALRQRRPAAVRFTVHTYYDDVDGYYISECVELPGCMTQGKTPEESMSNIADAIAAVLSVKLQEQVNARIDEIRQLRFTKPGDDGQPQDRIALSV